MTEKDSEKPSSSLVIVSRRMLVGGIAGIALFSFGLGYFFGYGGSSTSKVVRQVEADNKIVPSEERTVLDSSGKPTMVPPPAMPSAVPKEPPLKPQTEEGSKSVINMPGTAEKQKQPSEAAATAANRDKAVKKDAAEIKDGSGTQPASDRKAVNVETKKTDIKRTSSVAKTSRPASSTAIKETRKRVSNEYNVQVGAFENTVRAEILSKSLGANGYKVSITKYSPVAGKVFSRVRIGPFASRKEADDISSTLKGQGLEGLIITGLR